MTTALGLGGAAGAANDLADELAKIAATADLVGVSAQSVDGFSKVLGQFGLDAEGARDVLIDMAEAVGDALQDTEGSIAKAFAGMKVNLRDSQGQAVDTQEAFLRLADGLSKLSETEATFRAKEIGITDREALFALRLGREELERRWKAEAAVSRATKENIARSKEYSFAVGTLSRAFEGVTTGLTASVMPALTGLARALSPAITWLADNLDIVKGFFIGVAGVITAVYLPAMLSAVAASAPLILTIAAVAALGAAFALAYEDITAFMEGGDSMIGRLLERFPALGAAASELANWLRASWEGLKQFGADALAAIMPLAQSIGDLLASVGGLAWDFLALLVDVGRQIWSVIDDAVLGAFRTLATGARQILGGLIEFLAAAFGQIASILRSVGGAVGTVAGLLGFGGESSPSGEPHAVAMGQAQMAAAAANPLTATTSQSISNTATSNRRESSVTVGEINVQTQATDAQGIAGAVADPLRDQLRSLDEEFASGVDR
ncbi:phage tail tape measure protein [Azorhizophilus paspali]|uniref:phage tail tape measure protein n=1 Tax=Azorhizophilus paspali TaxID=69963 RepID=UPI00363105E1